LAGNIRINGNKAGVSSDSTAIIYHANSSKVNCNALRLALRGINKTIAIAIYDRVQAFDNESAAIMSAFLLVFSMVTIAFTYLITDRNKNSYG
jgi:hypothetical protein